MYFNEMAMWVAGASAMTSVTELQARLFGMLQRLDNSQIFSQRVDRVVQHATFIIIEL